MFLQLLRICMASDGTMTNSVQYFMLSDYESTDAMKLACTARYHNVLAADLQNGNLIYNAAYIISSNGNTIEKDVFDRREAEEI